MYAYLKDERVTIDEASRWKFVCLRTRSCYDARFRMSAVSKALPRAVEEQRSEKNTLTFKNAI